LRKLLNQGNFKDHIRRLRTRQLLDRIKMEESQMKENAVRTIVILAAVALAASSGVGADRVMLNEQMTATW
jgi:hypothetical protein